MIIYAIGDIHGMYEEFYALNKSIESYHREHHEGEEKRKIFLGDYVDRGPKSCEVVDSLILFSEEQDTVCLMGNHERMMVDAHNKINPQHWVSNGGMQTLDSYKTDFNEHCLQDHLKWMVDLPLYHLEQFEDGEMLFVHAGVMPGLALEEQDENTMLWIRDRFLAHKGSMIPDRNIRVVHGHTPYGPEIKDNRINVDSACCYGDEFLTAAVLDTSLSISQIPELIQIKSCGQK